MVSRIRGRAPLWALGVLFVLLLVCCGNTTDASRPAPQFVLQDIGGNEVTLEQYRGKVVLVDFWATWCPPCRKSIPELIALQNKYEERGIVVLGISMDHPQKVSNKALQAFKERFKINYPILRASEQVVQDYFETEEIAIPTMFVVNREGRITKMHVGFAPGAVEESIRQVLS